MSRILVAFDGSYTLHSVLHLEAYRNMTYKGQPTGGVFGGLNLVRNILDKFRASKSVFTLDFARQSFRNSIDPNYKANRIVEKDSEHYEESVRYRKLFNDQKIKLQAFLEHLKIPTLVFRDKEADDILYKLSKLYEGEVIIVSEDRDLLQLVRKNVCVYHPRKDLLITKSNFKDVVGVHRKNFALMKAIVGDGGDNVPGVKGVGPVTAKKVLQRFGSDRCTTNHVLSYCEFAKDRRARLIAESIDLVEKNLKLVDLSLAPWWEEEITLIKSSLEENPKLLEEKVVYSKIKAFGLNSIASRFSSWLQPFRRLR